MVADRGVRPRHGHAGGPLRDRLVIGGGDRPAHLVSAALARTRACAIVSASAPPAAGTGFAAVAATAQVGAAPVGGGAAVAGRRRRPASSVTEESASPG